MARLDKTQAMYTRWNQRRGQKRESSSWDVYEPREHFIDSSRAALGGLFSLPKKFVALLNYVIKSLKCYQFCLAKKSQNKLYFWLDFKEKWVFLMRIDKQIKI